MQIKDHYLKLKKGKCRFAITGNVFFNVWLSDDWKLLKEFPNRSYLLNEGDSLDILSTIKSNYGYLVVEGGFHSNPSIMVVLQPLAQSQIGPNEGRKDFR